MIPSHDSVQDVASEAHKLRLNPPPLLAHVAGALGRPSWRSRSSAASCRELHAVVTLSRKHGGRAGSMVARVTPGCAVVDACQMAAHVTSAPCGAAVGTHQRLTQCTGACALWRPRPWHVRIATCCAGCGREAGCSGRGHRGVAVCANCLGPALTLRERAQGAAWLLQQHLADLNNANTQNSTERKY
ncbi:hypothetical protein T492DRAFT_1139442 [Pavlovales sp. CCMP2436]|nr:hypothetical protein T492DRAFT_1139442 [Pavlovales sp. CCMP2436]